MCIAGFLPEEAEDIAAIKATNVSVTLPDGSNYLTLQTLDWNPLEDNSAYENKYYAEGVGLVREEDAEGEEQANLVEITAIP